jgi:hypothetical protein
MCPAWTAGASGNQGKSGERENRANSGFSALSHTDLARHGLFFPWGPLVDATGDATGNRAK